MLESSGAVDDPEHPRHVQRDRTKWQDCGLLALLKALSRPAQASTIKPNEEPRFKADNDARSSQSTGDKSERF